ncbi:hypothetical protein NLG97_g496 [Lecanicillium saksenae]|uniref:Uncharacterized protein n=1 Tax=Lecanicillium saksenae TaxID=468837 RepID=A0ACC1R864_9HYPO|nr:hypothetical protein NLG97_g496 [Lecanicillium saksenae]
MPRALRRMEKAFPLYAIRNPIVGEYNFNTLKAYIMDSAAGKAWIAEYLASHQEYTSAVPLEGGVSNYLYRLTKADGSTVILKHAEPHAVHDENWIMDLSRVESERAALMSISAALQPSSSARDAAVEIPQVLEYDAENYNLIMSDCGTDTKDLHTAFPSLTPEQRVAVGRRLGAWLASLHQSSTIDRSAFAAEDSPDRQGVDQRIELLSAGLPCANSDTATPQEAAAEKTAFLKLLEPFVARVLKPSNASVVHGDFWPGNILVGPVNGDQAAVQQFLAVIDWEGVSLGTGASDAGTMAGEAWLLCHFHRTSARASVSEPEDFGMFEAFLKSYLAVVGKVDEDFVRYAMVQFAITLSVGRGGKELMRPVKELGVKVVEAIMGGDEGNQGNRIHEVVNLGWGMDVWRDWLVGQ